MKRILLFIIYIGVALSHINAQAWEAGSVVDSSEKDISTNYEQHFVIDAISDKVFERMQGKSFPASCTTPRSSLRYLRLLHYNAKGKVQRGELICNKSIAQDLIDIFKELFKAKYPIERMVLVDEYDANDERSMTANNTSCFNFRFISGTRRVSKHGLGLAIDINPLYNPCYNTRNGRVEPKAGKPYATNRSAQRAKHTTDNRGTTHSMIIDRSDLCYRLFTKHGFRWGGNWRTKKDYQHFEK